MPRKTGVWAISIMAWVCFFAISYTACKKDEESASADKCKTITCQNEGSCLKGKCTCIAGYDGEYCQTAWITRYLGRWNITERIAGSNNDSVLNLTRKATWTIREVPGEPSKFMIDGMMGSSEYNGVITDMGQDYRRAVTNSANFYINEKKFMVNGRAVQLVKGSGTNLTGSSLRGLFYVHYANENELRIDTVNYEGTYAP